MRVSPSDVKAPDPQAARAARGPGEADGGGPVRREAAEEEAGRQEPLEEPGYGHGV